MILNALRAREAQAIEQAAQALRAGDLIGLPTETVYGLAADANNPAAVAKIFKAKDRPADHPLIVHVAQASEVGHFASEVPPFAQALMSAFWPGPLTLILPRRPEVAAVAAGGQLSIGLRCPSHPVAQALLKRAQALGVQGVAAPSANRFGRVSPTTAAHVALEFPKTETQDLLILDGGPCEVGIESSIVDCSRGVPVLLRPGGVSRTALTEVLSACGHPLVSPEQAAQASTQQAPKASGTLTAHYAPRAQVRLMSLADMQAAWLKWAASPKGHLALYVREKPDFLPVDVVSGVHAVKVFKMPDNADASAHCLFADLRRMDEPSTVEIWVQSIPLSAEWEGVADRLRRAAA
jgi:L-threonylcarbamoyladenylate synthase